MTMMMMMMMDAFRHISDRVGGGEDDDIVMQTPEQYLQKSRFYSVFTVLS